MDKLDLLDIVVSELEARSGELVSLSRCWGIPYDTVLRIKNRENDPGYSKVKAIADHLGLAVAVAVPREPTFCEDE
jgi:hypothetical protein